MSYIFSKIAHMQRMGIAAGIGPNGGACPTWLREQREADQKRHIRRMLQQVRSERVARADAMLDAPSLVPGSPIVTDQSNEEASEQCCNSRLVIR